MGTKTYYVLMGLTYIVTRLKDIKMQERIITLNNWKTIQKYTVRTYRCTII